MAGKAFGRKPFGGIIVQHQLVGDVLRIAKVMGVSVWRSESGGVYCDDWNGIRHFCAPGQQAPVIRSAQAR